MRNEVDRSGASAAWGVAAVVFGAGAVAAWVPAASRGSDFPAWPAWTLGGFTCVFLYLCFAPLYGLWPYRGPRDKVEKNQKDEQNGPSEIGPRDSRSETHEEIAQVRGDVAILLREIINDATSRNIPQYLPAEIDISRMTRKVWVRRGVRPLVDDAGGITSASELGVERPISDESFVQWSDISNLNSKVIVLAHPGMGKSWLIRTESLRLASSALDQLQSGVDLDEICIAFSARCDELIDASDTDLSSGISNLLAARHDMLPRTRNWVTQYLDSGKGIVLLDALDELPDATVRAKLMVLLDEWVEKNPDARLVLTSRIAGFNGSESLPGRPLEVELLPFTVGDVEAFIESWDLNQEFEVRLRKLVHDTTFSKMARIPLILALLCDLSVGEEALPETRVDLYGRIVRRFLAHEHRPPAAEPTDVDRLLAVLAPTAASFAENPEGWLDLMPSDRLADALRLSGRAFDELHKDAYSVIRELSVQAGILTPAGSQASGRNPPYLFLHRSFAEYLVAFFYSRQPRSVWLRTVEDHLWFDATWQQVLPLMAAQMVDPAQFLDYLISIADDPMYHALLTACRACAELSADQAELNKEQIFTIVHRLTNLLHASNPSIRRLARSQLIAVGRHLPRKAVDFLFRQLSQDEGPGGRTVIARALASGVSDDVTHRLLSQLELDQNALVRVALARSFVARPSDTVTHKLIQLLAAEASPGMRIAIVESLSGQGTENATEALIDVLLGDGHSAVRCAAARALTNLPGDRVVSALIDQLAYGWPSVRRAAALALSRKSEQRATDALLHQVAADSNFRVRMAAAHALSNRSDKKIIDILLDRLINEEANEARDAVARTLTGRIMPGTVAQLLDFLNNDHALVRSAIIRVLSKSSERPVTVTLLDRLHHDSDPRVRDAAARALADRPGEEITESLLSSLAVEKNERTREGIVRALSERPGDVVTSELRFRLSSDKSQVRVTAARALANRSGDEVTRALILRLRTDSNARVRSEAARALSGRPGRNITVELLKSMIDDDPVVQASAAFALGSSESRSDSSIRLRHLIEVAGDEPSPLLLEPMARLAYICYDDLEAPLKITFVSTLAIITRTASVPRYTH